MLRDAKGGFIGVEVELSQEDNQIEGLLQAVKYRHMVAVTEGKLFDDCRSLLVAYRLSPRIKRLCLRYRVEFREIKRQFVREWQSKAISKAVDKRAKD